MPALKFTPELIETVDRWSGDPGPPTPDNWKKSSGIRVYANDFVERVLARSHPSLPGVWFLPVIATCAFLGLLVPGVTWTTWVGLIVAGYLGWTLFEYVLHRWVFHHKVTGTVKDKVGQFLMHGYHHQFPSDPMRLVAPPLMSWPLAIGTAWLTRLALGADYWLPLYAGFVAGYLAYDWLHYYTHHARPRRGVGKFLKDYHLAHHFRDSDSHFGISTPLWDHVFGTVNPKPSPHRARVGAEASR
jgi:sterol desaturase/sphingolipid hydroxylase (fatty acid hydroxylase superfamily)